VYAQWFHLYEIDDATVALVLRTYASVFDHVSVWYGLGPDLILLGVTDPAAALDLDRLAVRARRPDFAAGLGRARIPGFPELLAHELLPLDVLGALPRNGPLHSLFHPRLADMAARAFFVGGRGWLPSTAGLEPARIGMRNSLVRRLVARLGGSAPDPVWVRVVRETCRQRPDPCLALLAEWTRRVPHSPERDALEAEIRADPMLSGATPLELLPELAALYGGAPEEASSPEEAARATRLYVRHYHHAVPFSRSALASRWRSCRNGGDGDHAGGGGGDDACSRGRAQAVRLLGELDTPLDTALR
jgi:hypothetical protein